MNDEAKNLAAIELPEFDENEKFELKTGVTYKGSFKISENGQIKVRPYKQGGKPTNLKQLTDGDHYAVYASARMIRIVMSFQKGNKEDLKRLYHEAVVECYQDLATLEL